MSELRLAQLFHDTYERLAPEFGYETRLETRTFDPESSNGRLMLAVCKELLDLGYVRHYGEGTVKIAKRHYEDLLRSQGRLEYLEGHGVDNWEGYADAMEEFERSGEW